MKILTGLMSQISKIEYLESSRAHDASRNRGNSQIARNLCLDEIIAVSSEKDAFLLKRMPYPILQQKQKRPAGIRRGVD